MLFSNLDNFYLTDEQLDESPSRRDGISREVEDTLRSYGAQMVQEAGMLLRCSQSVMATGQVLVQRFYCKRSLKEFNVKHMAAACLFLACKLEEVQKPVHKLIRELLLVFDRLLKRRDGSTNMSVLVPESKEYTMAKDKVIRYERELLRTFGFIVHCEHPHNFVINYVHLMEGGPEFVQEAWNILNDSLRTTLCVRFRPEVVGSGAIFYAARKLKIPLPESVPWWEVFGAKTEQVVEVVRVLHELYKRPKAEYIHVGKEPAPPPKAPTPEVTINVENSPQPPDSSVLNPQAAVAGAAAAGMGAVAAPIAEIQRKVDEVVRQQVAAAAEQAAEAMSTAHQEGPAASGRPAGAGATSAAADEASTAPQRSYQHAHDRDRDRDGRDRRDRDGRGRRSRSRSRSRDRDRRDRRSERSRSRDRGRSRSRDRRDRRDHHSREYSRKDRERDGQRERERDRHRSERDRDVRSGERQSDRSHRDRGRDERSRADKRDGPDRPSASGREQRGDREREREREPSSRPKDSAAPSSSRPGAREEGAGGGRGGDSGGGSKAAARGVDMRAIHDDADADADMDAGNVSGQRREPSMSVATEGGAAGVSEGRGPREGSAGPGVSGPGGGSSSKATGSEDGGGGGEASEPGSRWRLDGENRGDDDGMDLDA